MESVLPLAELVKVSQYWNLPCTHKEHFEVQQMVTESRDSYIYGGGGNTHKPRAENMCSEVRETPITPCRVWENITVSESVRDSTPQRYE